MFRRLAGIPDFISGDDMDDMISSGRLDPKVVFAYIQEVYRALKDNWGKGRRCGYTSFKGRLCARQEKKLVSMFFFLFLDAYREIDL